MAGVILIQEAPLWYGNSSNQWTETRDSEGALVSSGLWWNGNFIGEPGDVAQCTIGGYVYFKGGLWGYNAYKVARVAVTP